MSELKAFELKVGKNLETDSPLVVGVDNKWNSRIMSGEEVYLKPEADKVIADKDAEIAQLQAMLEERNRQIGNLDAVAERNQRAAQTLRKKMNHHKYKRCLKMAELCKAKRDEIIARTPTLILNHPTEYLTRWENRWLELAEKFKEAK